MNPSRGRPRIVDPELIALVVKLHELGMSTRKIAEALEGEGHVNTKGKRYEATQILRLIQRHC